MREESQHRTRRMRICAFSVSLAFLAPVSGWVARSWHRRIVPLPICSRYDGLSRPLLLHSQIVDVDFERMDETPPEKDPPSEKSPDEDESKTLFDLSLDADPEWKQVRVPFVDGENYIDAKLAFMAEMDGVSYGIGVPFEPAVAVTFENNKDGSVSYLSPDDDENEELMQLMAAQLQEHLGQDLRLKRTPRVLTVAGPLDNYTKNWKDEVLPDPVEIRSLLEDETEEDGLEFFHNFMKEELGEEEYEKTLQESSDDISDELLSLFEIPGLGTKEDDLEGMEEMFKSVLDDPDQQLEALEALGGNEDMKHDGVALKLVGYILPSGKAYSLVQLLKPYVLVGKLIEAESDTHFELLSSAEAPIVVPRLEQLCKEDFQKAGLSI